MAVRLIAEGTASQLKQLGDHQKHFEEGSKGYVDVLMSSDIAANLVRFIDERLEEVGVPEEKVEVIGRTVRVHFKTAVAPLVLIAGAFAASFVIMALVVAWKLYKLEPAAAVGISTFILLAFLAAIVLITIIGRFAVGPVTVGGAR